MRKTKLTIILLGLSNIITLCFLLVISIHFDVPTKILNKLLRTSNNTSTSTFTPNYFYKARRSHFAVYKSQVINIVMLGNSITNQADWNELLSRTDIANRGIGGDTTKGFLNRLTDIYALNPKICFIMGGINDFLIGVPVNKVYMNYIEILKELKVKGITPIIQSTLYVSKTRPNWSNTNKKVDELNKKLKEYADQENIVFIDLNNELSSEGALDTIYTYDGIHLLGSGYVKWRDLILSTLIKNKPAVLRECVS